jgi:hypothetical protein
LLKKSLPSGGLFLFCIAATDGARCGNCKKYYVQNPIKFPTFAADENLSRWNSFNIRIDVIQVPTLP